MPMPREEEDDLFHDEADVDFDDEAPEAAAESDGDAGEEKAPKKKKAAKKKSAAKKTVKKKAAKKKAKSAKRKAKAETPDDDAFGAGLTPVDEAEDTPEPEPAVNGADAKPEAAESESDASESDAKAADGDDEFGRPAPVADHAVHIYELGRLKRTIDRDFTAEDAQAFADQYTKTAKHYGRSAVPSKKDTQPAKVLD